jgi:hypothetical protein
MSVSAFEKATQAEKSVKYTPKLLEERIENGHIYRVYDKAYAEGAICHQYIKSIRK